jgi:hypothetical protein
MRARARARAATAVARAAAAPRAAPPRAAATTCTRALTAAYREAVRVDRPLLWRIMIVGIDSYYWLMVW